MYEDSEKYTSMKGQASLNIQRIRSGFPLRKRVDSHPCTAPSEHRAWTALVRRMFAE